MSATQHVFFMATRFAFDFVPGNYPTPESGMKSFMKRVVTEYIYSVTTRFSFEFWLQTDLSPGNKTLRSLMKRVVTEYIYSVTTPKKENNKINRRTSRKIIQKNKKKNQ